MQTFSILPHTGIGPIRFGMTRDEVRRIMGEPDHSHDERDWFLRGFGVDFDANGLVEFIETANSPEFDSIFDGESLHRLDAEDAVAHVSRHGKFDDKLPDLGYSYIFLDLQLSLWRPTVPTLDQDLSDPDGRHFHAVGVAVDGYFVPTE